MRSEKNCIFAPAIFLQNLMSEYIFKRKIYDSMLRWKTQEKGRSALLVEGARRIGKSTIVETFAKQEYDSYILIDFSNVSEEVNSLFKSNLSDLNYFFLRLQVLFGVSLVERKSVIIFDEVQLQPLARQAIKHLVKDGRYDYIETGSLISIRKNVESIVIPSEEERIKMYSMDYEEFRWALGDYSTMGLLQEVWEKKISLGDGVVRDAMRRFRLYMLVGGMPQAVCSYLETNDLCQVDSVKRRILALYSEDLQKLDPTGKAKALFNAIPAQLSKNASRYQVSTVVESGTASRLADVVELMKESMVVNVATHVNDPNVGVELTANNDSFKMFLNDTGLFVTLAFKDKDYTENVIYRKLLSDKLEANLGYIYENVVAQMLRSAGNELYYYTFPTENRHSFEIDFLLSRGTKLCPIEVKSSGYKTHSSLDAFRKKFSSRVGQGYVVYPKDLRQDGETWLVPVYMTAFL